LTIEKQLSGSRVLKHVIALCAGLLALGASASAGDLAQPVLPGYPGPVYPGYALGLPPHEIVTIVRSTGLEPLYRPVRHGPSYVLRAADPAGQEMRVTVDARSGRVLQIIPVLGPRYAVMPPPYGRPPGRIAMVPDGYGPNSRITALPPGVEGPPMIGPGIGAPPSVPPRAPAAGAPPAGQAGPPPLPRPRPKVAAAPSPAAPAAKPAPAAPSPAEAKAAGETTGAVTPPAAKPAPPPVEEHE
jgi:hypothetical protein